MPAIHPVLIFWAGFVAVYNGVFRNIFTKWPHWIAVLLFGLCVGATSVVNYEAGLVQNIKVCILVMLPLITFYPISFMESKETREKVLLKVLLGASVVVFAASTIALGLYMVRFGKVVEFMGMKETVGIRLYDPRYADSGMLLYGLYIDTNHAAVYAIIFALYSILLYRACKNGLFDKKWKNLVAKIYAATNFVVQICYFPLANSRGGWLCLGVAGFVVLFLFFYNQKFINKKMPTKITLSLVTSLICVVAVMGCLAVLRTGESKLSVMFQKQNFQQSTDVENKGDELLEEESTVDSFEKMNDEFGSGRLQIWREVPEVFVKKPVLGPGAGNHQYFAKKYDVGHVKLAHGAALHNSYLELLLSYGVLGFVVLMSFWGLCLYHVLKSVMNSQNKKTESYYIVSFVVLLIAGQAMLLSNIFVSTTAMYYVMTIMTGYLMSEYNKPKIERK